VSDSYEYKDNGLAKLIRMLKGKMPMAKVGVLAGNNARNDENTNATIGAKHEFGLDGMPVRSFLRMPVMMKINSKLKEANFFKGRWIKEVIEDGSFVKVVQKIGVVGENCVQDAFDSGGFGQWKVSDMRYKTNHQTLVETTQLRKSITSEVV
jgi:phage gpG-like protein